MGEATTLISFFLVLVLMVIGGSFFLWLIPIQLWVAAWSSGTYVGLMTLVAMRLRRVTPNAIVNPRITAMKAGLDIPIDLLESHFLAGGNVARVVNALISADKAGIQLQFKQAAAIDLAGRDVFEAVQMSVNPRVISTPKISAVAKDGIQLVVVVRITVRSNINRLVGGATEETVVARVGEGIVSTIGSARTYEEVLENPDRISKNVLGRGLDSGTAFEILSIDIADIDVGANIGAKLLTEKAEERAIHIFAENLRNLLLQPPLKGKRVLGVDPAYRTGCKLAAVDETGKLLEVAVIYPTPPQKKVREAAEKVKQMIAAHGIAIIAIGNGTASRETEQFIADTIKEIEREDLFYIIVNEAGASVYSASDLAKEEFPQLDVAERSAVSIARRLQDPLAELVKIDPKSVGVGQYQHDVSQARLAESLQFVVESVVNHVGVDVNTASASLLQYVSGINKQVAANIVKYREEIGRFRNRAELKNVPRLGAKTYEQCTETIRWTRPRSTPSRTPRPGSCCPRSAFTRTRSAARSAASG